MFIFIYLLSMVSTTPIRDIDEILFRLSLATLITAAYYILKYLAKYLFDEINKRGN